MGEGTIHASIPARHRIGSVAFLLVPRLAAVLLATSLFLWLGNRPTWATAVAYLLFPLAWIASWLLNRQARDRPLGARQVAWRIFLHGSIPFGLQMAGYLGVMSARWTLIVTGLSVGVFFGATMAVVLITVARGLRTGDLPAVDAASRLSLQGARSAVLARLAHTLSDLPKASCPRIDAEAGTVEVRTGWRWNSLGEQVTARLEQVDADRHAVEIHSRPVVDSTLVDFGVNRRNVDCVVAALAPTIRAA